MQIYKKDLNIVHLFKKNNKKKLHQKKMLQSK